MVQDSLDAFVERDAVKALDVCRRDDEVDGLYKQLFRELVTYMIEDPKNITRALHLLLVARNFERVADHATNIAEDVVYYVEGRDIRHLAPADFAGPAIARSPASNRARRASSGARFRPE